MKACLHDTRSESEYAAEQSTDYDYDYDYDYIFDDHITNREPVFLPCFGGILLPFSYLLQRDHAT